ncbi:MAG: LamG domain-containing protein, partial [Verrucomicrobiota bacterium]
MSVFFLSLAVVSRGDVPAITNLHVSQTNGTVYLTGFFTDADTNDQHRVRVEWGDGRTETGDLVVGRRVFTNTHHYLSCTQSFSIQVTISDAPVQLGLVGLWNFDAGSGADTSGQTNDGVVGAALNFTNDVPPAIGMGQSIVGAGVGGVNGLMEVPNAPGLETITDELTVAFWIKADAAANGNWFRMIRKGSEAPGTNSWMVTRHVDRADTLIRIDTTGPDSAFNQNRGIGVGTNVLDGTWHHLAYTLKRGRWEEYVDGIRTGAGSYPHGDGFANDRPIRVMGNGGNLVGQMDEVAVWGRALSSGDVFTVASTHLPGGMHSDRVMTNITPRCPVRMTGLDLRPVGSTCRVVRLTGTFTNENT